MLLMLSRLDIPQETYRALCSFTENYLQQMAAWLSFTDELETAADSGFYDVSSAEKFMDEFDFEAAPWWSAVCATMDPCSEDYRLFRSAMQRQYEEDIERDLQIFNYCSGDIIIGTAYARLSEILADYMER